MSSQSVVVERGPVECPSPNTGFEYAYWAHDGLWNPYGVALHGSSYFKVPKIVQWFTGSIGLHHVHYVRPAAVLR